MDKKYTAKEFIKLVLIDELKDVTKNHAFLSFALISIGIELIGKCLITDCQKWNMDKKYKPFQAGLNLLSEINPKYSSLGLQDQLRNGFLHTLMPKSKISLSQKKLKDIHLSKDSRGKTILVVEDFYKDFAKACKKIIDMSFDKNDKVNKPLLLVYKNN